MPNRTGHSRYRCLDGTPCAGHKARERACAVSRCSPAVLTPLACTDSPIVRVREPCVSALAHARYRRDRSCCPSSRRHHSSRLGCRRCCCSLIMQPRCCTSTATASSSRRREDLFFGRATADSASADPSRTRIAQACSVLVTARVQPHRPRLEPSGRSRAQRATNTWRGRRSSRDSSEGGSAMSKSMAELVTNSGTPAELARRRRTCASGTRQRLRRARRVTRDRSSRQDPVRGEGPQSARPSR
jgi:hypothetical protein